MPSKAWTNFDRNAADVSRLLEIHQDLGGDAKGRRFQLEVLNKSAIVLITSIWEAYCEDLAAEALQHIVKHAPDSGVLPVDLKKKIAKELKADLNEIASWTLADKGWRTLLTQRLTLLSEERNRKLNTPRAQNIIDLFSCCSRSRGRLCSLALEKYERSAGQKKAGQIRHITRSYCASRQNCRKLHQIPSERLLCPY